MKVKLLGDSFEVFSMSHFNRRAKERFGEDGLNYVLFNFCKLCENDEVADYLLNSVGIGEKTVLADVDHCITYALKMSLNDVTLITVFDSSFTNFRTGKDEKVTYYSSKKVVSDCV